MAASTMCAKRLLWQCVAWRKAMPFPGGARDQAAPFSPARYATAVCRQAPAAAAEYDVSVAVKEGSAMKQRERELVGLVLDSSVNLDGGESLGSAETLESAGLSRKSVTWLLLREKELLTCTVSRFVAGLKALEQLGVQREHLADLVQACPSVLFQDLETLLTPMLQFLREIGVDRQTVGVLLRYNPRRVLRVQNTNFRRNMDFIESLGISRGQVATTVKASPQILVMDLDSEIKPRLAFLQRYGLTEAGARNVVVYFPSILNASVEKNLLPKIRYLQSIGVSNIGMVLNRSPSFFGLSVERNVAPKVKKLEALGLSPQIIGSIIERAPSVLCLRIENIEQKIKLFHSIGVTPDEVARMVRRCPNVLGLSVENNLMPKIQFLQEIGVTRTKVGKVLSNCPSFFQCNLDTHLRPLIVFLADIGVAGDRLRSLVTAKPAVLTFSIEKGLTHTLEFLKEIGLEVGTAAMVRAFSCCITNRVASMRERLDWLVESGFTHDEALSMARKQPSILTVSGENISKKMDFLTEQAGLTREEICRSVALLTYDLELRIKPRHRVLLWLKETGRSKKELSFGFTMGMSNLRFTSRFIDGNPEAAALYYASASG